MTNATQGKEPPVWLTWSFWQSVGIIPGIIALIFTIAQFQETQKRVESLERKVEALEQQSQEMQKQIADVAALRKWAGCREQAEVTGRPLEFLWPTLECIEKPARIQP